MKLGSNALKRLFDIVVSFIALLALTPFLLLIAYRIKRSDGGPAFFRGSRLGKDGKVFQILKFRTMTDDAAAHEGPRVTAAGDPRITPLGQWLRDTKLNELPQLMNVLTGKMSLVGPRPEDPEIASAEWTPEQRAEILSVRPGITGPASVLFRHEEDLLTQKASAGAPSLMQAYLGDVMPSKLRLDQLYVHHRSFLLDLDVLFWTVLVLFPVIGRATPPEEDFFLGPLNRALRRYISWFTIDTMITFTVLVGTALIWRLSGPLDVGFWNSFLLVLGYSFIFSTLAALAGVNQVEWSRAPAAEAGGLILPLVASTAVIMGINYLLPFEVLPYRLILTASILAGIGYVMVRYRSRIISWTAARWLNLRRDASLFRERILIVGGGEAGQFLAWLLQNGRAANAFQVVGIVDDDLTKVKTRIQGVKVIGRSGQLKELVEKHDVGIIAFAIHNITPLERNRLLNLASSTPARLLVLPDLMAAIHSLSRPTQPVPKENGRWGFFKNGNGNGNGKNGDPTADPARVDVQEPALTVTVDSLSLCSFCLTSCSPVEVEGWLASLQHTAQTGDTAALLTEIAALRSRLARASNPLRVIEPVDAADSNEMGMVDPYNLTS